MIRHLILVEVLGNHDQSTDQITYGMLPQSAEDNARVLLARLVSTKEIRVSGH